ncbi:hypothetical protein [Methanolobus vulcani]|uniref:Uncharacterized protein n=1 Tax=Methanolobus vulcani TaxID=38026 RepID=A0A7Z8P387_9EURY|nr:hypothetical protein [Methanolobus vulcani]TQD28318.1 hypothetical protein FKV42_01225 [Methanolobus vulcani]
MDRKEKKIAILFIILLLLKTSFLFFPSIEPFYTITNTDQYAHEVTTSISSENGEYSWQRYYEIGPGDTIEVKKPLRLVVKWVNPFREADIFYSSSDYDYFIASKGKEHYIHTQPAISTCMFFELHTESEEFEIEHVGTHH